MIPSSKRSDPPLHSLALALALALGLLGCGASKSGFVTTSELPERSRRPDGVAVDPKAAPPPAKDVVSTEEGLVTLRAPLGTDRAIETVSMFFRALVAEDMEALQGLFTRDALSVSTGANASGAPSAQLFWMQRLRRLDYTKLSGEVVYREPELEIFRAEDAVSITSHPAINADALGADDVVVRVPIATPRVGVDRLLGDEIVLWLRRDGDRYRIYRLVEEFQMP